MMNGEVDVVDFVCDGFDDMLISGHRGELSNRDSLTRLWGLWEDVLERITAVRSRIVGSR